MNNLIFEKYQGTFLLNLMSQALVIAEIYSFIEIEDKVELRKYDLKIISVYSFDVFAARRISN